MKEASLQLYGKNGEPLGKLRTGAATLIAEAEQTARERNIAKSSAFPAVLREKLEQLGYVISEEDLRAASQSLDSIRRRSGSAENICLIVEKANGEQTRERKGAVESKIDLPKQTMKNSASELQNFFELEQVYPDEHARDWYERLKGLDEHKSRLLLELEMILFPARVEEWSRRRHQNKVLEICRLQRNRIPLVILEGDVGTGKTAVAETVGDALARRAGKDARVHLLKINTQIRGTGQVGEMSDLIAQAFAAVETRAKDLRGEPILLLIDEADALAARRDEGQMHHEDKAGLNTILQRLDNLRLLQLPVAVLFITNRPDALDPAVQRRAALSLKFERPNDDTRAEIICSSVPELNLSRAEVDELVSLTGDKHRKNNGIRFTASDITDRLLAGAFRQAYGDDRKFTAVDLIDQAKIIVSTPRMGTN